MISIKLVQASLLSTTLLLTSGCTFGYFENPLVPEEKPQVYRAPPQTQTPPSVQVQMPTPRTRTQIQTQTQTKIRPASVLLAPTSTQKNVTFASNYPVECTDDITRPSACNKGRIQAKELKPKVQLTQDGEVHQLQSFQGQHITVIERKNGYVFPQLKNKIVVLEMFGKDCSHCIKEMPILNRIRKKYRNKVEVVAIQVEGKMSPRQAKSLIRKHRISYPIISGETATNLQYHVQNTYGWTGILPFTMIIKNGVTEFTYPGEVPYREINSDIQSIVN